MFRNVEKHEDDARCTIKLHSLDSKPILWESLAVQEAADRPPLSSLLKTRRFFTL